MSITNPLWSLDPADPRLPPEDVWAAMGSEQREAVVAALPSWLPPEVYGGMPDGDDHFEPMQEARDVLRGHFDRTGGRAYVGTDMFVYYPAEKVFAPDVFVVLDASPGKRTKWVVATEGRGLDVVIEILVHSNPSKDLRKNVEHYARLGIPEYYVFEPLKPRLRGFRLPGPGCAYERVVPQRGRFCSAVLDMDLALLGGRLRFVTGETPLPSTWDLNRRLNEALDEMGRRAEAEAERAEVEAERAEAEAERAEAEAERADAEAKRADAEAKRAAEAERRLADALERLRRYESDAS